MAKISEALKKDLKKKKQKPAYNGLTFDSNEEIWVYMWCEEAKAAGLIYDFKKCEKGLDTFELIEKQYYQVDGKKKHCFASVGYTDDIIIYSDGFIPFAEKDMSEYEHHLDVKGKFSQHNDNKSFQIIRKMMYKLKGIYVHKVVPIDLFTLTWRPKKACLTPVHGNVFAMYKDCKTIKQYLETI